MQEGRTYGGELKFFDTIGTDEGEGSLLCNN
jgi:hypothetical protein